MRFILKTLSILFSYPGSELRELVERSEELRELLSGEDEEAAGLVYEFLTTINLNNLEELYVQAFELQPRCPLYAHYYTLKDRQSEVGAYLLEIKYEYKSRGYDIPITRELPDYLPAMLEFLSLIVDNSAQAAASFARKYIKPWLPKLERCIEMNRPEYSPLVRALRLIIDKLSAGPENQPHRL